VILLRFSSLDVSAIEFGRQDDIARALPFVLEWRGLLFPFPLFIMANAKEPEMAQAPTKPVKSFRLRGVSASVFENHAKSDGRDVTFHKVSLQRTYKDGNEFKTTTSFSRDDLPIARHVLQQAWEFILNAEASRGKEDAEE
jgi:hypothetical protein